MKMRKRFGRHALVLGATVACALVFEVNAQGQPSAGVRFKVAPAQVQALDIQTVALEATSDRPKRTFPAQVVAPAGNEQVVSSPVAGLVSQVHVEPFQAVRGGAALVRIVSTELGQLQLQLLQAASRLNLAQQTSKREQDLLAEGIVAQRRVQESQAALREAQAALTHARAALRLAGLSDAAMNRVMATSRPEDGVTLTAARPGTVTQIAVKPGQRVEAATALLNISQSDALALEVQVPAAEAGNWAVGSRVEVPSVGAKGRIVGTSPQVAPGTQTILLRATVEGKSPGLRPGQLVVVEVEGGQGAGFEVPLAAVAHDGDKAAVFVRTSDGFEARPVKVMQGAAQRARIGGELKAGEHIAITGIVALKGAWQAAKGAK